jgi:lipopolysaccharide biosynthesis glycosyltransferase
MGTSLAMTHPSVIHIAIYLDEGYAVPATVLVRSMLDNLGPSTAVHLHVLGLGLRDTTKRTMAASWPADRVVVHWVDVDWRHYEGVYLPTGYLSSAAYARLLIDRYLPADVEKVLTIDSDGIVLGDIAELWRLAPRRSCLMAVRDSFVRTLSDDTSEFIQRGCNMPDAPYFNSGLMLIDTRRWRDLGVAQRCFELASRHPGKAVIGDNSLLNAVLAGDWEPLPLRWNCNTRHLAIHSYPSIRGHVHAPLRWPTPCGIRAFSILFPAASLGMPGGITPTAKSIAALWPRRNGATSISRSRGASGDGTPPPSAGSATAKQRRHAVGGVSLESERWTSSIS